MISIIETSCELGISAILLYNMLRIFVIMRRPLDTVTKLNAGIYQLYIVGWAGYNIIQDSTDESIYYSLIGYYVYDTICLVIAARNQYLYFIHHILAIYHINLNMTYALAPMIYSTTLYCSMELSSSMLSWMKLCKEYYPTIATSFTSYTCIVYVIIRVIGLPIFIINYCVHVYQPVWQQNIVVGSLLLLYVLTVDWCRKMVTSIIVKDIEKD